MTLKSAFISSVMQGYQEFREVVAQVVRDLGMTVLVIDDQPSSPDSPRSACLSLVGEADVVILLTGDRYGYRLPPDDLSATHQEFKEAQRLRKPVLVFVHDGVPDDEDLRAFRSEAEDWQAGALRSLYTDPHELRSAVTSSLHRLLQDHAKGVPDGADLTALAGGLVEAAMPSRQQGSRPNTLVVGFALGPRQTVLRPSEMEHIADRLGMALVTGQIMSLSDGCKAEGLPERVSLSNDSMSVVLAAAGDLTVRVSLDSSGSGVFGMAQQMRSVIEEDVRTGLDLAFRAATTLLDIVDGPQALRWCGVAAGVSSGQYSTWTTRAQIEASPNAMAGSLSGHQSGKPVMLEAQQRTGIEADRSRLISDLVALLRATFR